MQPTREQHSITVNAAEVQEGEQTFLCTICGAMIALIATAIRESHPPRFIFSLTSADEADPHFGTVEIEWVD